MQIIAMCAFCRCFAVVVVVVERFTSDVKVSSSFQDCTNLLILVQVPKKTDKETPSTTRQLVFFLCAVVHPAFTCNPA